MAGKICVYIRDTKHPADLYDSSSHWYAISIHEVGSNKPLNWQGVNYNWVWLPIKGEFNKIAGEFEIPSGTYLIKGYAFCSNVVTQVAWVHVTDNETVPVNLVPTTVPFCLATIKLGVILGTAILDKKNIAIAKIAPKEVEVLSNAIDSLLKKLPDEDGIKVMSLEKVQKQLRKTPKNSKQ